MAKPIICLCVSRPVKELLLEQARKPPTSKNAFKFIEELNICGDGAAMQVSTGREKRAPSEYNIFIGDCMRGGTKNLKTCALEWKQGRKVRNGR
jgi:hypothetical protein